MIVKQTCPICNQEYETAIAKIYCSKKCYRRARTIREYPKTERQCEVCGTLFTPLKKNDQKFCSPKCRKRNEYILHKEIINKRNMENYYANLDHYREKRKEIYWSNPELYKEQIKQWRKNNKEKARETNLSYKNDTRFSGNKYLALKRDGFQCILCKSKENLVIHHKDESGQTDNPNNELDNLITVCNSCHPKIHAILRM